ncbi:MAG: hypothetical protein V2I33_22705, partial [Kangiellaceae bacterium]|nr:hypothetical protein [Kangiellaceae bacterium]
YPNQRTLLNSGVVGSLPALSAPKMTNTLVQSRIVRQTANVEGRYDFDAYHQAYVIYTTVIRNACTANYISCTSTTPGITPGTKYPHKQYIEYAENPVMLYNAKSILNPITHFRFQLR